ncbi:hypothetical protein OAZ21_02880, partial [Bacteroidota bacterium]|nr:hypothetical protein [Bacteroidota bacterium]
DSLETDYLKVNCCFSNVNAGVSKYILTHKGNGHTLWEDATAVVPHQDLQLNGNTLTLSNDPTPQGIDLSPYLGNTSPQDLILSGTVLSLTQSSQTVDLANIVSASNSDWTRDVSNNELYPDNINDEVGIGTEDPQMPLHIRKADNSNISQNLSNPIESELLMLENHNNVEAGYQSVSISLNGLYNDAKIIGGNEDFYGSDGYLAINTTNNGSSTEKFRITANGNIGMGTASPKNNLDVENNVAIGQNYSGSNDAPVNGLLVEGSTRMGISNSYMNNYASVLQPSEQLWVNVSPSNTSYNYGVLNTMHATHNNDKYGIYNHTGEEGLGNHYGLHSVTNGNYFSSNQVFGISSIINHKGTGSSYGMYVENNSTGTGTSYGLYIENNASGPAGSGDEYGLYVENAEKNYIDGSLKVISNIPGQSSNINSYVTLIENTFNAQPSSTSNPGNAPNGLAIKLGTSSPNRHANYITFFNSSNSAKGRIEGQTASDLDYDAEHVLTMRIHDETVSFGALEVVNSVWPCLGFSAGLGAGAVSTTCPGNIAMAIASEALKIANRQRYLDFKNDNLGVTFSSGSADYAEYLERKNYSEKIRPAQIVGSNSGKISLNTEESSQLFVVSTNPGVLGNMPDDNELWKYEKVAFMGQVPTMVRGLVNAGDFIIPSGLNDGTGIGVSSNDILPEQYGKIVGVAWSSSVSLTGVSYINMSIGLNNNDLATLAYNQQKKIDDIEKRLLALESGDFSKKEDVRPKNKIESSNENENKVEEDTYAEDLKKDNLKFQINEDDIPSEISQYDFDLAIELIQKAYEISEIDIKSDKMITKLIEDKNYQKEIFEYIDKVFQNNKVKFLEENGIEVK